MGKSRSAGSRVPEQLLSAFHVAVSAGLVPELFQGDRQVALVARVGRLPGGQILADGQAALVQVSAAGAVAGGTAAPLD